MPASDATSPASATPEPLTYRACKGVEVFTTRGLPGLYSRADMAETVDNFYRLGPYRLNLHRPPLGVGHDDGQGVLTALLEADPRLAPWLTAASLEGDDAPAAGWVNGLKAVPDPEDPAETMLKADFADIPAPIADLIDARAYREVSAEIYDNFAAAGRGYGHALRRVALTGWQPPLNKALADVPPTVAQFSEPTRIQATSRRASTRPGAYLCFSENRAMTKAQMIAALKGKLTLSDAAAAAMTDAEVGAVYKKFSEPDPVPPPVVPPVAKMDEPLAVPRDQMIAELQAAGQDATQLAALDDATLATVYAQWKGQQTPAPANPVAAMAEVKKYSEAAKTLVTTLTIHVAAAKAHADGIKKFAEDSARTHKLAKVNALRLDLIGASGIAHCTPAEFEIHREALLEADDTAVKKFSESNGRTFEGTAFDRKVAQLKSLPAKKFSEKLPAAEIVGGGGGAAGLDGEKQKVRAFAEANADAVKAFGMTTDQYVGRYAELKAKVPDLTPEKYTHHA